MPTALAGVRRLDCRGEGLLVRAMPVIFIAEAAVVSDGVFEEGDGGLLLLVGPDLREGQFKPVAQAFGFFGKNSQMGGSQFAHRGPRDVA